MNTKELSQQIGNALTVAQLLQIGLTITRTAQQALEAGRTEVPIEEARASLAAAFERNDAALQVLDEAIARSDVAR